jgi:hypothetical protein
VKRRLFNLLAILSLLLGVATVALWVRSFQMGETVVWRAHGPIPPSGRALWAEVGANEGTFFLATIEHQPSNANEGWSAFGVNGNDGPRPVWRSFHPTKLISPNPSPKIWTRLGFEHQSFTFGFPSSHIDLSRQSFWRLLLCSLLGGSCRVGIPGHPLDTDVLAKKTPPSRRLLPAMRV